MDRRQRVRRTAFLCIHTLTNVACYRAGINGRKLIRMDHFWMMADSNFAEMAILMWCKIFADKKAKHYSFKIVSDPAKFTRELLAHFQMTEADFEVFGKLMRNLRDKFIAHLDDATAAPLPKLDPAVESAKFLLLYLFRNENGSNYLEGVPRFPDPVYGLAYDAARVIYTGEPTVTYTGGRKPTQDKQESA